MSDTLNSNLYKCDFTYTGNMGPGDLVLGDNIRINRGCFSPPPKVIPEPPLTLDQQCDAARSRLRVSIEANCAYAQKQMTDEYKILISKSDSSYYHMAHGNFGSRVGNVNVALGTLFRN